MSDNYVKVTVEIATATRDAIGIKTPAGAFEWLPRSLIHGGDELRLDKAIKGERVTFRLVEWKAERLGL